MQPLHGLSPADDRIRQDFRARADELEIEIQPETWAEPAGADLTYGSWSGLQDSVLQRAADKRWTSTVLVARRGGKFAGALPVAHPAAPGRAGPDDVLALGCSAYLKGGAVVRRHQDRVTDDVVLYALFAAGRERAHHLELTPTAPYLPADQLPGTALALAPLTSCRIADVRSILFLQGARSLEDLATSMPQRERRTLREDVKRSAGLAISIEQCGVDDNLVSATAELIANVKRRNDTPEHPRLVAYRIAAWLRSDVGRPFALTCRSAAGTLRGVCLARAVGSELELFEVGVDESPDRHQIYLQMVFLSPISTALEMGLRSIDLGFGHPEPKRNRGASQTLVWDVVGARGTEHLL